MKHVLVIQFYTVPVFSTGLVSIKPSVLSSVYMQKHVCISYVKCRQNYCVWLNKDRNGPKIFYIILQHQIA